MLKHVQISPHRNRSDSVSLRSAASCASSICGSPEPSIESLRPASRASSYCSLDESAPQTTIKVFTSCLKLDIEYKTLGIRWDTCSKDVVAQILRKCKMRQKDLRLFHLSMEVMVRKAGVKTVLVLDDDARPAILQACHPKGDSRFCLNIKPGGLIRVGTSILQPTSLYKSLMISEETTSDELLRLLLSCYNLDEPVEKYSLYEVCSSQEYQRKLHPDDLPLRAQQQRTQSADQFHFIVRKNPHFSRCLLPPIVENKSVMPPKIENATPSNKCRCMSNASVTLKSYEQQQQQLRYARLIRIPTTDNLNDIHKQEENNKTPPNRFLTTTTTTTTTTTYIPVYNSREIHGVCNSFSSFDIDKKLWNIETFKKSSPNLTSINIGHPLNTVVTNSAMKIVHEAVNNNPAKGYGNFVYI